MMLPSILFRRATNVTVTPPPLVVPPSDVWSGDNVGPWSLFSMHIGTPPQQIRVMVSTASSLSLVILPSGCTSSAFGAVSVPSFCVYSRGGLFNPTVSTTWKDAGSNLLGSGNLSTGLEQSLGSSIVTHLGVDMASLGSNNVSLGNIPVGGIYATDPYMGMLGLGVQSINYSSTGQPQSSIVSSLRSDGIIPSLSWSYTAGAKYRLSDGSPGQLIFGGYDKARFMANSVVFDMASSPSNNLIVAVQSIVVSGGNETSLLPDPILASIDSTNPDIWLPAPACRMFEEAFGISLDQSTGLYLVNDTLHEELLSLNPQISFQLATHIGAASTVLITLPYQAFELPTDPSISSAIKRYFPLQQADNSTQYTLGRTFLQEAYLVADYERRIFTVSQSNFVDNVNSSLVSIPPLPSPTTTSSSLPTSSLAAIIISAILGLGLVALVAYRCMRKRTAVATAVATAATPPGVATITTASDRMTELTTRSSQIYQLDAEQDGPHELPTPQADSVFELPGDEPRAFLPSPFSTRPHSPDLSVGSHKGNLVYSRASSIESTGAKNELESNELLAHV